MGHVNDEIRLYLIDNLELHVGILQLQSFPLQVMIKPYPLDTHGNVGGEYRQYMQVKFIQGTGSAFVVGVKNADNAVTHFEGDTDEGFGRVPAVAPDFREPLLRFHILQQKRLPGLGDGTRNTFSDLHPRGLNDPLA